MASSRESSWPRDQIWVSYVSCIGRHILYHWAIWNPKQSTSPLNIVHLWGEKYKGIRLEIQWGFFCLLVCLVSISWFPPEHHPSPTLSPGTWAGFCSGVLAITSTSSVCDPAIPSNSVFNGIMTATCNQPWWEYLYQWPWQTLQISISFFSFQSWLLNV